VTDHSFTDEEQLYYQTKLAMAKKVCASVNITDPVIIAEVFGKIATDIYYLRQEQINAQTGHKMDIMRVDGVDVIPKKPSRIPLEGTPWRDMVAKTSGKPFQGCPEDQLIPSDQKILDEVREQPDSPLAKAGYRYWANEWQGKWYLNRRRLT